MTSQRRVLFVSTPLRGVPDIFPPYAVLSLMSALRKSGFQDQSFYNIDFERPTVEEAVSYVLKKRPQILAVSAVVSTAYAYVKTLTLAVKQADPRITIIVGGPLCASAEILLRKTGTDFVCISEGEFVMTAFVKRYSMSMEKTVMADVPGLIFLDNGELVSTEYADPIDKHLLYDVDYSDLDEAQIAHYMPVVEPNDDVFYSDGRLFEESRRGLA